MRAVVQVVLDEEERTVVLRALEALDAALGPDSRGKMRVRTFGRRLIAEGKGDVGVEPLAPRDLERGVAIVDDLIERLAPQTTVEWWRPIVPELTADDALRGLADERAIQVSRLLDARAVLRRAQDLAEAPRG